MKPLEKSIPSFAELALKYETINQEQLNEAYQFMEEKKSNGDHCSLEDAIVLKKMATQYQVNLLKVIRNFLIIRKRSEQFGEIAVKRGYATPEQIKYALAKQHQAFREARTRKMVGDMLVESGVITKEQQQAIAKEQQSIQAESQKGEGKGQEDKKVVQEREKSGKKGQNSNGKFQEEGKSVDNIEIVISANAMEGWVKILPDPQSKPTNGVRSDSLNSPAEVSALEATVKDSNLKISPVILPTTLESLKAALEKKGVRSGICSDAVLQCHIDREDSFFPAAVGEQIYSPMPEYQFNVDQLVGEIALKRNKTLAFIHSGHVETRTKDLFGRTVVLTNSTDPPLLKDHGSEESCHNSTEISAQPAPIHESSISKWHHPVFRCGAGAILSEDGMRVLSEQSGYPALSLDGRLYIFPVINILGDADTHFGPIDPYASVNVAGTVTGAYPVTAGQMRAREIDGATISSIGDVTVEIGINRSRIKTQGSVRAKYIHNSRIEAFGDVVVEHEIIDSTIIISGRCDAAKSRIIASRVSAKRGVIAAGVGSDVTEPCHISVGCEDHIVLQSQQITRQIRNVRKELDDLTHKSESLKLKIEDIFKKMVELKLVHDRAKASAIECQQKVDIASDSTTAPSAGDLPPQKGNMATGGNADVDDKTVHLIDTLKVQMESAVDALRRYNQQKNSMQLDLEKVEKSINAIKPRVDREILELEMDRNRFLKWSESHHSIPEIRISGRLSQATRVKGAFASITIQEDTRNIQLIERQSGTPPQTAEIIATPLD